MSSVAWERDRVGFLNNWRSKSEHDFVAFRGDPATWGTGWAWDAPRHQLRLSDTPDRFPQVDRRTLNCLHAAKMHPKVQA